MILVRRTHIDFYEHIFRKSLIIISTSMLAFSQKLSIGIQFLTILTLTAKGRIDASDSKL